jgi:serine/threonine protein kinase/Tfp pilus assembly protein PilF
MRMGLSQAQMARLSELLDEALPLSAAARREWIESLPANDRPLVQTLRGALLAEDPSTALGSRLDRPPRVPLTAPANDAVTSSRQPGEQVDAYQLIRLLGTGGMAEVWLARRADGVFDREVALKIPRLDQVRAEMAERFAHECKILATLEYPGIARLYDAGVDASGVPYFAMEHVDGETLAAWCDARDLDIAERLRIFQRVLDAVGFAHARHVIHRDLKPSNILVTKQGEVRLLDFGVARLLQEEVADKRSLTRAFGRALTPEYASPELLRGQPVDLRSDIYSLGIVLYELLTGVRPGQARVGTDVTRAMAMPAALREVLDTAMAQSPADRFPDVASFAARLRHVESGGGPRWPWRSMAIHYAIWSLVLTGVLVIAAAATVWVRKAGTAASQAAVPAVAAATVPVNATPRIAVLPFADLSEQGDQAYLSDGLAEELLNLLTRIPELHVTARASSFAFRGEQQDVASIARQLNVDHLLSGSVRKSGNRIRFSVQLVQTASGTVIWSDTYDRELQDIFAVQEDVANAVVDALKLRLLAKRDVSLDKPTLNTRAYEEYLLGLQYREGSTLRRQQLAMEAFERAAKLDPQFAGAHAGIALTAATIGDMTMKPAHFAAARAAAERALQLSPRTIQAYIALSQVRRAVDWDFPGAQRDLEAALRIEPNNLELLQAWGGYLSQTGRFKEAVALQRSGVERNPMASTAWEWLGTALMDVRDYEGARRAFDHADAISPYSDYRLQVYTLIAVYSGDHAEALRLAKLNQDPMQRDFSLALAEYSAGRSANARAALKRLMDKAPDFYAAQISRAYAWYGDNDQAFQWLDRAIDLRDPGIASIKSIPEYDKLRDDPRYLRALQRMNLAG